MKCDKGVTCIVHIHWGLYEHTYIAIISTSPGIQDLKTFHIMNHLFMSPNITLYPHFIPHCSGHIPLADATSANFSSYFSMLRTQGLNTYKKPKY